MGQFDSLFDKFVKISSWRGFGGCFEVVSSILQLFVFCLLAWTSLLIIFLKYSVVLELREYRRDAQALVYMMQKRLAHLRSRAAELEVP